MERFKHEVSGGWWIHEGEYVQAGVGVRQYLQDNTDLQRWLGWATSNISQDLISSNHRRSATKRHGNSLWERFHLTPPSILALHVLNANLLYRAQAIHVLRARGSFSRRTQYFHNLCYFPAPLADLMTDNEGWTN